MKSVADRKTRERRVSTEGTEEKRVVAVLTRQEGIPRCGEQEDPLGKARSKRKSRVPANWKNAVTRRQRGCRARQACRGNKCSSDLWLMPRSHMVAKTTGREKKIVLTRFICARRHRRVLPFIVVHPNSVVLSPENAYTHISTCFVWSGQRRSFNR